MNVAIDSSCVLICPTDVERIRSKAKRYGRKYHSLDQLLEALDKIYVKVLFQNLFEINALTLNLNGQTFIGVNSKIPEAGQIKAILHECGHLILHSYNKQRLNIICVESFVDYREMEADCFAFFCCDAWIRDECNWCFIDKNVRMGEN